MLFGNFSESIIYMSEFLSLNNHNRTEIYNYSIKQVFYYYNVVVKIKNQELQNQSMSRMIANATATTGQMELFNEYIGNLSDG